MGSWATSAGGGLAAAVCQIARDAGGPAIALQALICPILEVGRRTGSREEFGEGHFITHATFQRDLADYVSLGAALDDPRLSPLLRPRPARTASGADPYRRVRPVPRRRRGLRRGAKDRRRDAVTVRHPGMIHYFYALARAIPYAQAAAAQIGAQIRAAFEERLAGAPSSLADQPG